MVGRMKRKAARDYDRVLDRFEDRSTAIMIERGAKIPARNGTGPKVALVDGFW